MISLPNTNSNSLKPEWVDDKLLGETMIVWGKIYGRKLTTSEALEILRNVGRLIDAIQERKP